MIEGDLANFAARWRRRVAEAAATLKIGARRQRAAQRRRIRGEQLCLLLRVDQTVQFLLVQPLPIARGVWAPLVSNRPAIAARRVHARRVLDAGRCVSRRSDGRRSERDGRHGRGECRHPQ